MGPTETALAVEKFANRLAETTIKKAKQLFLKKVRQFGCSRLYLLPHRLYRR